MLDFILLMHKSQSTVASTADAERWDAYLGALQSAGHFVGGSAIGSGICVRKEGAVPAVNDHLTGFIRVRARDLEAARRLVVGNPVYEDGGAIEIRALPRTGTSDATDKSFTSG